MAEVRRDWNVAKLELEIDQAVLERARAAAERRGTSLDAVLEQFLRGLGEAGDGRTGFQRFLEITRDWKGGSGPGGRTWKREDLYDRGS